MIYIGNGMYSDSGNSLMHYGVKGMKKNPKYLKYGRWIDWSDPRQRESVYGNTNGGGRRLQQRPNQQTGNRELVRRPYGKTSTLTNIQNQYGVSNPSRKLKTRKVSTKDRLISAINNGRASATEAYTNAKKKFRQTTVGSYTDPNVQKIIGANAKAKANNTKRAINRKLDSAKSSIKGSTAYKYANDAYNYANDKIKEGRITAKKTIAKAKTQYNRLKGDWKDSPNVKAIERAKAGPNVRRIEKANLDASVKNAYRQKQRNINVQKIEEANAKARSNNRKRAVKGAPAKAYRTVKNAAKTAANAVAGTATKAYNRVESYKSPNVKRISEANKVAAKNNLTRKVNSARDYVTDQYVSTKNKARSALTKNPTTNKILNLYENNPDYRNVSKFIDRAARRNKRRKKNRIKANLAKRIPGGR